jgi:hypothetical protein
MNKYAAPLFAGAMFLGTAATPAPEPGPVVIPLHAETGRSGEPRLGIDVTRGSSTQRVMFDTGSTGLRVVGKALPTDAYRRTGRSAKADYGFGFEVRGEEPSASVSIGAAHANNMPFQVIDEFGCGPQVRDCPTESVEPSLFSGIYSGIFGAYITPPVLKGCCVSPLFALDGGVGRRYVVHAAFDAPTVTLNPGDLTVNTFGIVDFAAFGAPRGCLRIYDAGQETCGPVIFDTGTPQLLVTTTGMVPPRPWSHATLRIGTWTHDFRIGGFGSGGVLFSVRRSDVIRIVVGLTAMQEFDVYYDLDRRRVGVVTR